MKQANNYVTQTKPRFLDTSICMPQVLTNAEHVEKMCNVGDKRKTSGNWQNTSEMMNSKADKLHKTFFIKKVELIHF